MAENCCDEVCFTELVKCVEEGGYKKAWGWTASYGNRDPYRYTPPPPWEYDPSFSNVWDGREVGTHGGCSYCAMTLVHLQKQIIASEMTVTFASTPAGATVTVD